MTKTRIKETAVIIKPPNLQEIPIRIKGTAPYMQHRFSKKVADEMLAGQMEGGPAKNRKKREARDPEQEYKDATYFTADGKHGIPAPAFRSAMISACRLAGFQMTRAKISLFIEPDAFDAEDGTPLVYLEGEPEMNTMPARLATGVASIAIRPMWRDWSATVRIKFDADQFAAQDVHNLLMKAGLQVGIGEGRPDSRKSHGLGLGTFEVLPTNGKKRGKTK